MELVPTDIEVDRTEAVHLTWPDGRVSTYALADLRVACPCATCRNQRAAGGQPGAGRPAQIVDAALVGNWGLSIAWNDGHATGIYAWDQFARWAGIVPPDA